MANLVLKNKTNGRMIHFVKDAVKVERDDGFFDYSGGGVNLKAVNLANLEEVWTDDILDRVMTDDGCHVKWTSKKDIVAVAAPPAKEKVPKYTEIEKSINDALDVAGLKKVLVGLARKVYGK